MAKNGWRNKDLYRLGIYTTNIMNQHSISGNNTEQVLQSQITDPQDNIVMGSNIGVGPGTFTANLSGRAY